MSIFESCAQHSKFNFKRDIRSNTFLISRTLYIINIIIYLLFCHIHTLLCSLLTLCVITVYITLYCIVYIGIVTHVKHIS